MNHKLFISSVITVLFAALLISPAMAASPQGNQILDIALSASSSSKLEDDPIEPSWMVDSLDEIGCFSGEMTWTVTFTNASGLAAETLAWANGVLYMNEEFILSSGDDTRTWSLYDIQSGGATQGTWPLPGNTPINVTFNLREGIDGSVVHTTSTVVNRCDLPPLPAMNSWGLLLGILGIGLIGGLMWRRVVA